MIDSNGLNHHKDGKYKAFNINHLYFKDLTEEKCWLLGLFASDGCISSNNVISLCQTEQEDLIKYIKNILDFEGNIIKSKTLSGKYSYGIYFTSKKLQKDFAKYNIVPKKSLIYEFPKKIPSIFIKDFIRGYIDGDGCITESSNAKGSKYLSVSFVGTENFIKSCKELIPFKSKIRKIKHANNCYELRWNGRFACEFGEWLFLNKKIYKSKKTLFFIDYIENKRKNTLWFKRNQIKILGLKYIKEGKPVLEIANQLDVAFQTVYKWKNESKT